jgi:tRNA pseudouridine38-40 synthase
MELIHRYRIDLSYKGTHFHGWQIQPNAISVQEELNDKLSKLCGEEVNVVGAGRTDTGVHARNYVAHFDLNTKITKMTLSDFVFKLNTFISKDIVIHDLQEVDSDFHARFGALSRKYKYFIHQRKDVISKNEKPNIVLCRNK